MYDNEEYEELMETLVNGNISDFKNTIKHASKGYVGAFVEYLTYQEVYSYVFTIKAMGHAMNSLAEWKS